MPLSGAAMTSENTAAASFSLFTFPSSLASRGAIARVAASIIRIVLTSLVDQLAPRASATPFLVHERRHHRCLLSPFALRRVAAFVLSKGLTACSQVTGHGQCFTPKPWLR